MRTLITVIVFIFSLQSLTKADDISDLQIEVMSIGDSLLDFYAEEQILNEKKNGFLYSNKEYFTARLENIHGNLYEYLQFQIKADDPKYTIYSIEGINFFDNIDSCLADQKNISSEIKNIFPNAKKIVDNGKHDGDPTGKSMAYEIYYVFKNGGNVTIACYDWSDEITKDKGWLDNLKVIVDSQEFHYWLNNKAYE